MFDSALNALWKHLFFENLGLLINKSISERKKEGAFGVWPALISQ